MVLVCGDSAILLSNPEACRYRWDDTVGSLRGWHHAYTLYSPPLESLAIPSGHCCTGIRADVAVGFCWKSYGICAGSLVTVPQNVVQNRHLSGMFGMLAYGCPNWGSRDRTDTQIDQVAETVQTRPINEDVRGLLLVVDMIVYLVAVRQCDEGISSPA